MSTHRDASVSDRRVEAISTTAPPSPSPVEGQPSLFIDMTVPEAVARLVSEPRFRRAIAAFCGKTADSVLHAADEAVTERDFQTTIGSQFLQALLAKTAGEVTYNVDKELRSRPACVYISNHRDIVLDTALLNAALIAHGKPIPHVAIGDNLLETPWLVPFYRLCRSFVIHRELSGKQLYEQSRQISEFIRDSIARGEPVWLAQRPGRTKDGADKTEPALLRMVLMAQDHRESKAGETTPFSLHVTPVAVSYEFEPCDVFKAAALISAQPRNAARSRARRDANSIMRGLTQNKGRISLTIRPPLVVEAAQQRLRGTNRADLVTDLAQQVDREILAGYSIWSTNYLAHDLLNGQKVHAGRYTDDERQRFLRYIDRRAEEIVASRVEARDALLSLYARPVDVQPTAP